MKISFGYIIFVLIGFITLGFILNPRKIVINKISNNPIQIIKPSDSLKFYFDKVDHPDYDMLLDSIITPEMNEKWGVRWKEDDDWTITRKLRIWCREFLDRGGWKEGNLWEGSYSSEIYSIPRILEHRKKGNDGLCSYYATFFMHSCIAVGINNRRVGWWHPGGDQLNEVYIPSFRKWIAMSPLYNCWYSDKNGPLSMTELNEYKHRDALALIDTNRDFQISYPNPEITKKNWLADYSWDIYFWNKNGYLLLQEPKAYRYENPKFWPYRNLEASFIIGSTQNTSNINFNASSLKINPIVNGNQILVEVEDYYVVNFKEFVIKLKNNQGKILMQQSFTQLKKEINVSKLPSGKYHLEINALNTRLGKSEVIVVDFSVS